MAARGYLDELDVSIEVRNYAERDERLEWEYTAGNTEITLEDATEVISRHIGDAPGDVVAANNVNEFALLAGESFAEAWAERGAEAFATLHETDDPFTLARSHSDEIRLWLDAVGASDEHLDLTAGGDIQFTRNQFEDGEIDGAFHSQPELARLARTDVGLQQVAWIGDAVASQPGGVTVMREDFREDRPEVAKEILRAHVRATEFLTDRPDEAAAIVSNTFGDELSTELAGEILRSETANFVTDPRPTMDVMDTIGEYPVDYGLIEEPISADAVVDPSLYEAIS